MKRKPTPGPSFVNLRGQPLDLRDLLPKSATAPASPAKAAPSEVPVLTDADVEQVFDALALAGCRRNKTWLLHFMRQLGWRTKGGVFFGPTDIQAALQQLTRDQRAQRVDGMQFDVAPQARIEPLARLLRSPAAAGAWRAWAAASTGLTRSVAPPPHPDLRHNADRVAYTRLVLYGDAGLETLMQVLQPRWGAAVEGHDLGLALVSPFLPERFEQMPPALRNRVLTLLVETWLSDSPLWRLLFPVLDAWADRAPADVDARLRLVAADRRMHRGELAGCQQLLVGLGEDPHVPVLQAALLARQGQWQAASQAFAAVLKALAKMHKVRRGLAPYRTVQWYLWALLAQPEPAAWALASKFALGESGSRTPAPDGWGLFVHAVEVRLGDARALDHAFSAPRTPSDQWLVDEVANALILAAWAGIAPTGWTPAVLKALLQGLHQADRPWKAELVRQACERLGLATPPRAAFEGEPWAVSYFGPPPEAWRDALAAIQALGKPKQAAVAGAATLIWRIRLDPYGRVAEVKPFEPVMGVRGPGKPRAVTLTTLKRRQRLDARDAAVVRCIQASSWRPNKPVLDRVGAAAALVGHPAVAFDDAPGQPVDLVEAVPLLEVRRQTSAEGQDQFAFHLADPVLPPARLSEDDNDDEDDGLDDIDVEFDDDDDGYGPGIVRVVRGDAQDSDRFNNLRIVRDGPDRARLLRITPAQRRVAELVSQSWTVPAHAQAELDAALRVLAGHFQLHSDAAAGQEVPSDARLRAQLSPLGDGLQLRLVVRPFGDFGPEGTPGQGRDRVLTMHQGLSLATRRLLAEEAAHLAAVREALPFLDAAGGDGSTWQLADPEEALTAVERLPQLAAVAAVEWPRGKPVRVQPVAAQGLSVQVGSGRDWFALEGELRLDESRVLSLQRLLQLSAESRQGRFIALGDGEYLALTDQLRRQLADLQALAQADGAQLKLPATAAAWLADTLDGAQVKGDRGWRERLKRLDEAAALMPAPPPGLQAELRPYQADGFVWMARLAHAGLGACLADDMGLGKTVQTLALLLQRATLGPALVLAPTSVCANWMAEAARFAPGLSLTLYGIGDRDQALAAVGAGHVVVASYALVHLDIERFVSRPWATLVLDEAQALKNAATQRAKSVASLDAGFRLGLSGTPVENRLADLWSLMNILNPGLLGSSTRFNERFATPIERDRDDAARQRLRRLVAPFLLRRTKSQVLSDLPARTEIIHRVEPGPEERTLLEALRRQALEQVAAASSKAAPGQAAFQVLAELTRLRRAACDPRLVAPELGLVGAKVQEFERLANELVAGRHKALVFSQFTDFLKLLAERLDAAGISHQYLDGSTPAARRAERVAAFQRGEGDLFLISLKAGGFGLNLTAADYVIIVDPWWNPAAEDQAMGRAHRIGQLRPVTVYRLVTAGSIEERIVALHRDKRSLADGILEGQDDARPVDAAELRALLDSA